MQRYRVNYTLLIGIVLGSFVACGAVYGIWLWRMTANADNLMERAQVAEDEGNLPEAITLLRTYRDFKPNDDEAGVKQAMLYVDYARDLLDRQEFYEFGKVRKAITDALFKYAGESELRRHYLDLLCTPEWEPYFAKDALDQIKVLLGETPNDVELLERQARCYFYNKQPRESAEVYYQLLGYNPQTDEFSEEQALAPKNPRSYNLLSRVLHQNLESPELALRVSEQMVSTNPDSADAHLYHGSFLSMIDKGPDSDQDFGQRASDELKKAYELDPTKPAILIALSNEAIGNEDPELAEKYLREGLENKERLDLFYSRLAKMESDKGNFGSALKQIDLGLDNVDEDGRASLTVAKIDIQIESGDITGAEATIKGFQPKTAIQAAVIDFQKARILVGKRKWLEAKNALEAVRPKLLDVPQIRVQADILLGMAYGQIGYREKSEEVFQRLARQFPKNKKAKEKADQMKDMRMGRGPVRGTSGELNEAIDAEMAKPEAEQNWAKFDKYVQQWCEKNERSEVQRKLVEAQVLVKRKLYPEARKKLGEAYSMAKDDMTIQRAAVRLVAADPDGGPQAALKLLERTIKNFGDQRILRLDKADLLLAINEDNLAEQLQGLTEGIDEWSESDQVELWNGIASRLYRAKFLEQAEAAWNKVVEINQDNLPALQQVFEMAAERNDDEAMITAQKRILELVGSKTDPSYAFTEALRNYIAYRNDPDNEKIREKIFDAIEVTLEGRPDWDRPYLLSATVHLQDREYLKAREDFRQGFERGRGNTIAVVQYVRLLNAQGDYNEALKVLEPFDPSVCVMLLGRDYPEILLSVGQFRNAAEAAERLGTTGGAAENAATQLWYGNFMDNMSRTGLAPDDLKEDCLEKATSALAKAVELNPDSAATWKARITNLLVSSARKQIKARQLEMTSRPQAEVEAARAEAAKLRSEAEALLREAQLTLEDDSQTLLVAQSYENLGRWFDAENTYSLALKKTPDESGLSRQMATFFMSKRYPLKDGNAKAVKLINGILRNHAEDPESVPKQNVKWARGVAAQMYSSLGSYQDSLKAEKLLTSNAENKALPASDKLQLARLLAKRPEPVSRQKAIKLLEEVKATRTLKPELDLVLGQLYYATGNWPKCRDHMASVRTLYPDSVQILESYVRMRLDRGGPTDLRAAEEQLKKLQELAPGSISTYQLSSMVYSRMGDSKRALQSIRKILPKSFQNLNENQYRLISQVAQLLIGLEEYDSAEQLLQLAVKREGATLGDQLRYASFIGIHRDADKGFELLSNMANDSTLLQVASTGIGIVREKRDEVNDRFDDQITKWLERAEREDPGAVKVALAFCQLYDVQGEYETAADTYRKLLANDQLVGATRASILNNLAYMLALGAAEEQSTDEAVRLLNEATQILGPISDILDTRAVIWINRGEYQKAVDDMTYAVTDGPTASKYFHKALAHMGLKQNSEAVIAWDKAEDLGLTRESVGRLEQSEYDALAEKIEKLKARAGDL